MIRDLAQENIALLQQGFDLAQAIDDDLYCREIELLPSSVGKHLRHILDFYQAFFEGLPSAHIDYDQRHRDPRLERERQYFCTAVQSVQEQLTQLKQVDSLEMDSLEVHSCEGLSGKPSHTESNTGRELQFLLVHVVHHYALIALILRVHGFQVPEGFGVAYSTRLYLGEVL